MKRLKVLLAIVCITLIAAHDAPGIPRCRR